MGLIYQKWHTKCLNNIIRDAQENTNKDVKMSRKQTKYGIKSKS